LDRLRRWLPDQAAVRKAEREIAEFRKLQSLHKEFVEVNAEICRTRPARGQFGRSRS
jgi:hypothetical protein